ncbi:MAG: ABC transporter permease [Bryobacteraceae bacterium]
MDPIPRWRRYARLTGPNAGADVDEELRFHIQAKIDDLVGQGMDPAEARREAERQFGDLETVRATGLRLGQERERRMEWKDYWAGWRQDVRYGMRTLRRDRSYAIITILVLAIGIGTNTAVFSVLNAVLLRPLPFAQPDQLVWFTSARDSIQSGKAAGGLSWVTYTVAAFEEFERNNRSFQQVTSYNPFFGNSEYTLRGAGEPQPVNGVMVAGNFFQTLGLQPVKGRLFTEEECQRGGRPAMLLSHGFWQRHFNGDPEIVGKNFAIGKESVTVVGVLPPSFDFGSVFSPGFRVDIYVPLIYDVVRNWGNTLAVVGRLKPTATIASAQAEADVLFPQFKAAHKEWWGDYTSSLSALREYVSGKLRRPLLVLWSAVGLIMLIVCVNLSNLLLARAAARSKEFAIRGALGAGRGRLFRQLLAENLVLTAAGATGGLALAIGLTRYLAHQESLALPLLSSVRVDGPALWWMLAMAAAWMLVFAIVAGFRISATKIQNALKDTGPGMSAGRGQERMRSVLVVSEVALACVLVVGAGLLLRSFLHVMDVDLGFDPSHAAVIRIDYDDSGDASRRGAILQETIRRIEEIPGVERAGITDMLPLGRNRSWGLAAKGVSYQDGEDRSALVRIVTPGYLEAMGIRLQKGRDFTWRDTAEGERAVIINETAARRFWHGQDALGRLAQQGRNEVRVVGVVADLRQHSLEQDASPEMFLPATQAYPEGAELVIRSRLDNDALAPAVMSTLRGFNPGQPAAPLRPVRGIVDLSVSPRRFFVLLVTGFAAIGLLLAAIGIYGVISYSVALRRQEIGIRMALGASGAQVQLDVVGRALRLALTGMVLGGLGSLAASSAISALLYGTEPTDTATFAAMVSLIAAIAAVAGYLPARKASRIDPWRVIRSA